MSKTSKVSNPLVDFRRSHVDELRLKHCVDVALTTPITRSYGENNNGDLSNATAAILGRANFQSVLGLRHKAQVLTYLRLYDSHVGLLLNFNVPLLRDGIQRVVL